MRRSLNSFFLLVLAINFIFLNTLPIFAITHQQKNTPSNQLAEKYCDSLGKNLFTGLDNESTLKYEYFFSAIPENSFKDQNKFLKEYKSDVNLYVHMRFQNLIKKSCIYI